VKSLSRTVLRCRVRLPESLRILKTAEIREKFRAQGQAAVSGTPEQLASLLQSESARYSKIVKAAGIRAE